MARYIQPDVAAKGALEALGISPMELSLDETQKFRDAWRRVYARPLYRAHGVWHRGRYDWHVFSYKDTYALVQEAACQEYHAQRCSQLIVLPNDKHDLACRITVSAPPSLEGSQDVYISPPNLAWTMVLTHEDGWLGPYFSRTEWINNPPPPAPKSSGKGARKRR